jgi:TPR repeat protein
MEHFGHGVYPNYQKALMHYEKAATANQPEAFLNIAHIHYYGLGKSIDYLKAYEYYSLASNYNFPQAEYHLGQMNQYGQGTQVDLEAAELFYKRSAEKGNSDAQIALQNLPIKEPDDVEIVARK